MGLRIDATALLTASLPVPSAVAVLLILGLRLRVDATPHSLIAAAHTTFASLHRATHHILLDIFQSPHSHIFS